MGVFIRTFYLSYKKFYTDNIHASVTNSMSAAFFRTYFDPVQSAFFLGAYKFLPHGR